MLTPQERKLLREKIKSKTAFRYLIESRLRNHQSCVVRVERPGNHRTWVSMPVTQEDLDIALAQLTLLGEL